MTRRHRSVMLVACGTRPTQPEDFKSGHYSEDDYPSRRTPQRVDSFLRTKAPKATHRCLPRPAADPIGFVDALLARKAAKSFVLESDFADYMFRRSTGRMAYGSFDMFDESVLNAGMGSRYISARNAWRSDGPEKVVRASKQRFIKCKRRDARRSMSMVPQPVFDQPQPEDTRPFADFEESFPGEHELLGYRPRTADEIESVRIADEEFVKHHPVQAYIAGEISMNDLYEEFWWEIPFPDYHENERCKCHNMNVCLYDQEFYPGMPAEIPVIENDDYDDSGPWGMNSFDLEPYEWAAMAADASRYDCASCEDCDCSVHMGDRDSDVDIVDELCGICNRLVCKHQPSPEDSMPAGDPLIYTTVSPTRRLTQAELDHYIEVTYLDPMTTR